MYKCFYHSADLDGKCSAAIVLQKYPDCKLYPINYEDKFPWDDINSDDIVFMVDFAIQPYNEMDKLNKKCKLIWIDHHKTAIDYLKSIKIEGLRDIIYAGCELTWKYIFKNEVPLGVELLGRYDVWDMDDSTFVLPFQYGMRIEKNDPKSDIWKDVFEDSNLKFINRISENGEMILKYQKQFDKNIIDSIGYDIEWEGYKCLVCNFSSCSSQSFESKYNEVEYDLMIAYKHVQGKHFTVSIYTTKDIDGSKISKKYGGGGHPQASGFQCKKLPWIKD